MNYLDRITKQVEEFTSETQVVRLTSALFGPTARFPHKVEIVHGGQRFEQARIAAVRRQADKANVEGPARDAFVEDLTTLGNPKQEILAAHREMLLETVRNSGIVKRFGWTGPRFASKSSAKKWVDGTEPLYYDAEGVDKIPPPPDAEVFKREEEMWTAEEMPPLLTLAYGAKKEFGSKTSAEEWRKDTAKNLLEIAGKTKAKARAEYRGSEEDFEKSFLETKEGGEVAANEELAKSVLALEFSKRVTMFSVPDEVFLEGHFVGGADAEEGIFSALEKSPTDVLRIYRARFHWDQKKRLEQERLAKNS